MQKWKRMLVTVLVMSVFTGLLLAPTAARAEGTLPTGFSGMDSVNLTVDTDYPWHKMNDEEATAYGLEGYKGTDVYIAGNSGNDTATISNLAITVTEPGALTFDYALSAHDNRFYYLGYSMVGSIGSDPNISEGSKYPDVHTIAGNKAGSAEVKPWQSYTIYVDEEDLGEANSVTIYVAYHRHDSADTDTSLNYAAIRNISFSGGNRDDVVQFETGTESMGTVTAELVTGTEDEKGNISYTYTSANVNDLAVGSTYRLKAVPNNGYQFYGWVRHYTYNSKNYTAFYPYEAEGAEITVDADTYYVPVFAAEGTYYIRNGANFYSTETPIDQVLNSAASGNMVVLVDDYEVPASVTELNVPAGVTFYIPFRGEWGVPEYGNSEKVATYHKNGAYSAAISGTDKAYATLMIPSTATMTVNGNLILGAERNWASQDGFQGHISGRFGRIQNNGNIRLNSGAIVTCFGLIDGTGTLLAQDGSTVKESLVISDFSGGKNSLQLYNQDQMPFKRYSAQNIQCRLQVEAKAKLSAMAVLYAMSGHNEVDVDLLGNDGKVVFCTKETRDHIVILERTYDASKQITSGSGNCTAGVGTSYWNISGGLDFQTLTISLEGVINLSTARSPFPLPYNMHLTLNDGTYVVNSGVSLLPGSSLTIAKGATLDLAGKLYAYDGLAQSDMSGDKYPTRSDLTKAGFAGYGELILNGNMYVRSGATLGGVVQTTVAGAMLTIEENAHLVNSSANLMQLDPTQTKMNAQADSLYDEWAVLGKNDVGNITTVNNWIVQDGGYGHYDDNTTWFNLPARIWNGTELTQLTAGTYLSKAGANTTVSDQYVCRYVPEIATGTEKGGLTYTTTDGKRYMNDGTETFNRTVSGIWAPKSEGVEIASALIAGSDKTGTLTNGVTLETVTVENDDGSYTLSISPKKDGVDYTSKLVYLIKCTNADTTVTTATVTEGGWILPAGTVSISIECAALGDISCDGLINITDLAMERRTVAGTYTPGELAALAGDVNSDVKVNITDLAMVRRYVAGTYKW